MPTKRVDADALDVLKRHRWPGNVRELENLIRRLAVLHSGDTIPAALVAAELREPERALAAETEEASSLGATVERHLTKLFLAHGGDLPPPGLYERILEEVERPLAVDLPRRGRAATRSARRNCSASTATRCARRSATWVWKYFAA